MVKLSKTFYVSSAIVGFVASIVFSVGAFFIMKSDATESLPYLVIGGIGLVFAGIVAMVFYYKSWESIQDGYARTTPGKAIGFLFIPFFGLYWIFQAVWGFSKDYNSYVDRHALPATKVSEGLFLTLSILPLTGIIPFVGLVTGPVQWIVFAMAVSQACEGINALATNQDGRMDKPPAIEIRAAIRAEEVLGKRLPGRALSLYCIAGEFARETLMLPADGISIGRDPTRVNLVLGSSEISGAHARVLPDPKSGQVWLEDLRSLNGTFYAKNAAERVRDAGWVQLQGKVLLAPGARFRLAVDGPEFEIRES